MEPQWLLDLQLALRCATSTCAVIGLSIAWHDWQHFRSNPEEAPMEPYISSIPAFALICLVAVLWTPITFSVLLEDFELSDTTTGSLRAIALFLLIIYFFTAAVRRLRAYGLPDDVAKRKALATLAGIVAVFLVGFYGQ